MDKDDSIFITNHKKLPGSAIAKRLEGDGFRRLKLKDDDELDLTDQRSVRRFFQNERPSYVFLTSARSGGIKANIEHPAEFLYYNLQVQNNVIEASWKFEVKKLIFLGASCVYPRNCHQPMKEEYLLAGALEDTSEPYAVAKIAGIKMCQYYNRQYKSAFISVIPATIYGLGDDFDRDSSHVIPALIRKFHSAKVGGEASVSIWGSGDAKREFIFADDIASACLFLMQRGDDFDLVNIGAGTDTSIRELAYMIKDIVGFKGRVEFDTTKPEGVMRKLLDTTRLGSLGWKATMDLESGIKKTYPYYLQSL